jgi:hypothetical protein
LRLQGNRFGCQGNNGWQAERLPYNDWDFVTSIDDHRFSDRVRDARIERRIAREMSSNLVTICLYGADLWPTNTGRIKSERVAVTNAACLFAKDPVRTETIAEGSSGK